VSKRRLSSGGGGASMISSAALLHRALVARIMTALLMHLAHSMIVSRSLFRFAATNWIVSLFLIPSRLRGAIGSHCSWGPVRSSGHFPVLRIIGLALLLGCGCLRGGSGLRQRNCRSGRKQCRCSGRFQDFAHSVFLLLEVTCRSLYQRGGAFGVPVP
jgi:hypothetical protein